MRASVLGIAAAAALLSIGAAHAQSNPPKTFNCGELPDPNQAPKVAPIFRSSADLADSDFDCLAWQDFIFVNWPVNRTQRGVPDPSAPFGAGGRATVWESYKTVPDIFLPGAQNPGPWNNLRARPTLSATLSARVGNGVLRHLIQTSKVSRPSLANIMSHTNGTPEFLRDVAQAGGGTLFDLNGNPVYYEVGVNRLAYDYIVQNELYNAQKQGAYAAGHVIAMPFKMGNDESSVVYKAAWKVLSSAERQSGRFHATQALLEGSKTPVTVGLVGFHMFIVNSGQGAWATFEQVDNAPIEKPASSGTFNFYNPNCKLPGTNTPCPVNVKDADPGQVLQIVPNESIAAKLNDYMHGIITAKDPKSVWQYYNLINVQWALNPKPLASLPTPANAPLPDGTPNTKILLNPVLETFLQGKSIGCLACHQYATVAAPKGVEPLPYASGYSFFFGHATDPQ